MNDRPAPKHGLLSRRSTLLLRLLLVSPLLPAALSAQGVGEAEAGAAPAQPITDFAAVQRAKVYRAERTTDPIEVDGAVEEPAWARAMVGTGFYQTDPSSGVPATEETEFRILYDDQQIYVAVVARQEDAIIISDLKREFAATDGDQLVLFFDTFDDDRNGFAFMTNPGSAIRDVQLAGGVANENWDGIYEVRSRVYDWGWSAEFAIPFKTLRFDDRKETQTWGFNIQRISRARNEWVQWSPAPRPFRIFEASVAGTLEGISGVRQGMNLKVKPFVVGNLRGGGALPGQDRADAGVDVKLGVTSGLTLDLTVNTDFSQVEADEQQVNLTRFSLFFPEKREFFLENLGIFDVCGNAVGPGGPGGPQGRCGAERDIVPFFSRRIGLSGAGQPLSMRGGARLTGKLAGADVGLLGLNVAGQNDGPSDTWMVARVRRDVLANSQVGAFAFDREPSEGESWNRAVGADGSFNFFRQRLNVSGFLMRTATPSQRDGTAGTAQVTWQDRLLNVSSGVVAVSRDFQNDFGFTPRVGITKLYNNVGVTPRFSGFVLETNPRYIIRRTLDPSNRLLSKFDALGNTVTFRDGASFTIFHNMMFELLERPFTVQGQTIPAGEYDFSDWNFRYGTSRARRLNVSGNYRVGGFYDGDKREINFALGLRYDAHLQTSVSWGRNLVDLPRGDFTTDLVAFRADLAFSPRMILQSFIQYNTAAESVSTNIRYRFIHHPLSDFFIVYNEVRPTEGDAETLRGLSLKVTHLLNF